MPDQRVEMAVEGQQQNIWLGRVHHMAVGAGAIYGAGVIYGPGAISGACVIAGVIAGVAGVGAGAIYGAGAGVIAGGIVADAIVGKTKEYADDISENGKTAWKRTGAGLLASFALVCGVGVGKLAYDSVNDTDRAAAADAKTASLTQTFSITDLKEKGCVVEFKNGEAPKVVNGTCAAKQLVP